MDFTSLMVDFSFYTDYCKHRSNIGKYLGR